MAELVAIKRVGVMGAGQMGSGIAQVMATAGLEVILNDVGTEQLDRAAASIKRSLEKLASRGTISTEQQERAIAGLSFSSELKKLAHCDLVVEAIVENESIKADLFRKLDEMLPAHSILASNTSSIPITRLASVTKRPGKVIGMHFMNPVPIMKLVEIIPGMATESEVTSGIVRLAEDVLGKTTVTSHDYPGFIVNRILMPMINEAFRALMEGVASAKDIDAGMKLGCNQPMGPLALADFIGLDTCAAIMNVLYEGLGDSRYAPCPLLKKYVEAGYLGVKTKQGVYKY